MSYCAIKLNPNVSYDYLYVNNDALSEEEINTFNSPNYIPTWHSTKNPIIVAQFNNNLKSSMIGGLSSPLVAWAVYRQKIGEQRQHLVAEVSKDQLSLIDYMCSNYNEYAYYVVPITQNERGISLKSDIVVPEWNEYSITGLKEINTNIFIPTEIWTFRCNLNPSEEIHNTSVKVIETFSKYPKIICGDKNYQSMGLSCLLEDMDCNTVGIDPKNQIELYQKWINFVSGGNICLYKDIKGILKIGFIMENSTSADTENIFNFPSTISFQFIETSSTDKISVYNSNMGDT